MGTVDGPIIVVLKVEMHCEDCAMQVRRSVKGFKGVEAAASDILESKLTIIGKVDPFELRSHVESKTHKKVELIYPAATIAVTKEAQRHVGVDKAEKPDKGKDQKNAEQNVPNSATSVVLKVRLHCKGCTQRIIKQIYKIKGVDSVSVDSAKDLVTVKGTMDVKNLPGFLTAKLRKAVEIVNLKKDGDGDHKEKNEKKDNGDAGKKEGDVNAAATNVTAMDGSKMDYYVGGAYGFYQYRMEIVQAPQIFSDENPNACSIM